MDTMPTDMLIYSSLCILALIHAVPALFEIALLLITVGLILGLLLALLPHLIIGTILGIPCLLLLGFLHKMNKSLYNLSWSRVTSLYLIIMILEKLFIFRCVDNDEELNWSIPFLWLGAVVFGKWLVAE